MKKSNVDPDFTKIKKNNVNLQKGDKKLGIKSYFCMKFFPSLNMILKGERWNPKSSERKAILTAIDLKNGSLIGRIFRRTHLNFRPSSDRKH